MKEIILNLYALSSEPGTSLSGLIFTLTLWDTLSAPFGDEDIEAETSLTRLVNRGGAEPRSVSERQSSFLQSSLPLFKTLVYSAYTLFGCRFLCQVFLFAKIISPSKPGKTGNYSRESIQSKMVQLKKKKSYSVPSQCPNISHDHVTEKHYSGNELQS